MGYLARLEALVGGRFPLDENTRVLAAYNPADLVTSVIGSHVRSYGEVLGIGYEKRDIPITDQTTVGELLGASLDRNARAANWVRTYKGNDEAKVERLVQTHGDEQLLVIDVSEINPLSTNGDKVVYTHTRQKDEPGFGVAFHDSAVDKNYRHP